MEQRLIDANALKKVLIEVLEDIKRNPRMDGYEMCLIASCATLSQMIDDAPTIWVGDANDLSLKLLDEHERGMLFEYQNLGYTIDHLRELVQAEKDGRLVVNKAVPSSLVFVIRRGEDDLEISGLMLLATVAGYVICTPFADGNCDLEYNLQYACDDTKTFGTELEVFPASDCYLTQEKAEVALGGGNDHA